MAIKRLNLIKEHLDKTGVSQYALAKNTGLTYESVQNYYHGRREPSLANLFRIAEALKVNPKELINS